MLSGEGTCWPAGRSSRIEQGEGKGRRKERGASEGKPAAVKPQDLPSTGKALSPHLPALVLAPFTLCKRSANS